MQTQYKLHLTQHENFTYSVILDGMPICAPTSLSNAQAVALKAQSQMRLKAPIGMWMADMGRFLGRDYYPAPK